MAVPPNGVPLANLSFALSAGCLLLWAILLAGRGISRISTRNHVAVVEDLTVHDRTTFCTGNENSCRPDPWLEYLLRGAFAEFDRELRKIMPRLYNTDPDEN
jgi:hypothetical protein